MRRITVKDNQSLFDISIQEYGSLTNIVALAFANDMSITDELTAGQDLLIPDLQTEQNVLKYYTENNIIPATTQLSADIEAIVAEEEGEGYYLNYLMIGTGGALVINNNDEYLITN
jgi:hypothetical protein